MKEIYSFMELKNHEKIISAFDFQVLKIHDANGVRYISNGKNLWSVYCFRESEFFVYDKEKQVGEFDKDYFWL